MPRRVLAGDIGGTKTNLAIYALAEPSGLRLERQQQFASQRYADLTSVVREFLAASPEPIAAAAFGVAGPVVNNAVRVTNLPWRVEAGALATAIGCGEVRLMNDLESTAYGALFVDEDEILTLNPGTRRPGNRAVIAAGTGLGEALLFWDGRRHWPSATEGGHADFSPRNELEIGLLRFLLAGGERVSWERVLSGPGLRNIFRYLDEGLGRPVAKTVRERLAREDSSAVIGEAGVAGVCTTCVEAVELFVSLYGAQAGNLALASMALGGVYVGGGIVNKLRPKVTEGAFLESFLAKPPHRALLEQTPLCILLNPRTSQLGAAHAAAELIA
jgi:glucokinase